MTTTITDLLEGVIRLSGYEIKYVSMKWAKEHLLSYSSEAQSQQTKPQITSWLDPPPISTVYVISSIPRSQKAKYMFHELSHIHILPINDETPESRCIQEVAAMFSETMLRNHFNIEPRELNMDGIRTALLRDPVLKDSITTKRLEQGKKIGVAIADLIILQIYALNAYNLDPRLFPSLATT
jgi:hypothetical protein